MTHQKVSVIIPVYNAVDYIERALNSAINQKEVGEVIIINDGSTDGTTEKLHHLRKTSLKIKIFKHEGNVNKGRSASRNLGIKKATCEFIAFLDADDFYLENRFTNDIDIFSRITNCDGVYNAIGSYFYRKASANELRYLSLVTINYHVDPENLFHILLNGENGHFSIDGLTLRKRIFDSIMPFREELVVAEDTELIWRLSLKCLLYPGILEYPVAKRGVHNNNVFDDKNLYKPNILRMYEFLFFWSLKENFKIEIVEQFLKRIWTWRLRGNYTIMSHFTYWISLIIKSLPSRFLYLHLKFSPFNRVALKLSILFKGK
ncbi:glycosyltransferase family 2 protein [Nonlabens sp. YIK11]|uniref:glycosyltransferase family 2 protein n=1 Tax=Nonlabens sp. YIK11 TaxID=1453349 RepID=UPI0006DC80EA|nr:glycosyltransferase family A protein [Nonlabens sp. YIK11]